MKKSPLNAIAAVVVLCVALAFVLVSCWERAPDAPQFPTAQMQILRGEDTVAAISVEVARTDREMAYGLMFRHTMPDNHGMIFIFPDMRSISMWMKNTFIPLDMVFFDDAERVVAIHRNAKPQDESIINPGVKAQYVLELNAGAADRLALSVGDRFELNQ